MVLKNAAQLALVALLPVAACRSAGHGAMDHSAHMAGGSAADQYVAKARADSARLPYVEADVEFMSGMIGHHAQAVVMSRWAATHDASAAVRTLAARIINAQTDEIALMQNWLRDRNRPVPSAGLDSMEGHAHHDMMPGMLNADQMKELENARGQDFDRLFLRYMIMHHRGAVDMVKKLFATEGAGQDETVFKFASDVNVDQTTEITRMEQMLLGLLLEPKKP